ncbi:MAG: serine hydrolase, partial [Thermoleophilaceae bacterium]
MLLVAFLRDLDEAGEAVSEPERLTLGYMIRISDNASADSIYARVGDPALRDLAASVGMRDFRIDGSWADATVTPADQARLFAALDRLLPARFRRLARNLLETVSEAHTWGIPTAARPRWRTFFKGGWRPEAGAEVVHQAGLLEGGGRRLGIAVMTAGDPSMVYGERTIEGVARRLLSGGGPAPVATVPVGADATPRELLPLAELERLNPPEPPPLLPLPR